VQPECLIFVIDLQGQITTIFVEDKGLLSPVTIYALNLLESSRSCGHCGVSRYICLPRAGRTTGLLLGTSLSADVWPLAE
jgi:hypothetical protein